jgi:general secretion pathway protein F
VPIYSYKGYHLDTGASSKGKVESDNPRAARQKLRQRNRIVASEIKEEARLEKAAKTKSSFNLSGVSMQDVAIMTRQFATLQSAHVPLDESLRALTQQVEHPMLQNTLAGVKEAVQEGKSLGEAMAAYPAVFNKLYVNMVRAGESSGMLEVVLTRLADFIEYQVKVRGQVLSAITYPILMMFASGGVIAYLFISVVPKLTKVFESLKVTMPWYTKLLITISAFLQTWWPALIMAAVLGFLWFKRWVATDAGKRKFDTWMLRMPIFGPIVMRINVSRFTKTLSTLLSSGVPIIQALEITVNIISNSVIAAVVDKAKISVQEGEQLGTVIERSGQFPPLVVHMIMTGERTGQLEEMLGHVAVAYDAEVERKVGAMISIIEPIMIIVMAGISAVVIIAMLMPMLSVMGQIR